MLAPEGVPDACASSISQLGFPHVDLCRVRRGAASCFAICRAFHRDQSSKFIVQQMANVVELEADLSAS